MKASETTLQACLSRPIQYTIPIFQRTYSWTLEQTNQLFKDILRLATNPMVPMHFLGSLVYVQGGLYTTATVVELIVIDGQQRLTTITLFLAALAHHFSSTGDEQTAREIRGHYLLNHDTSESQKYKILLTQNDKATLIQIIEGKELLEPISDRIKQNYDFLLRCIESAKTSPSSLYEAFKKLIVVDVSLDRTVDNPQLIFESLNSTGLDLSQADLIRNYVLMGLEKSHQDELYNDYWRAMEMDFGQQNYVNYFDMFIRDYLTMKTGKIPKLGDVYHEFKKFVPINNYETMKEVIADVASYSKFYSAFALGHEKDVELNVAFNDLHTLKVDVVYPYLLETYGEYIHGKLTKSEFLEIVKVLESYIFRRMICGIPTNSLNKTFATLSREIDHANHLVSLKAIIVQKTSYRQIPDDEAFKLSFTNTDIYHKLRTDYIFDKLENYKRKEHVKIDEYTIEHIMPQNPDLSIDWKNELGDDWQTIQNTYLHTIGNLTLTGYNSNYSDKPFITKRDLNDSTGLNIGFKSSPLHVNEGLGLLEHWNEQTIKDRAQRLGDLALKIWPYPELTSEELSKYHLQPEITDSEVGDSTSDEIGDKSSKIKPTVEQLLSRINSQSTSDRVQEVIEYCSSLPDVIMDTSTNHITFRKSGVFAAIFPQSKQFWVDVRWVSDDPKKLLRHKHPVYGHIRVADDVILQDVFDLIKQSYIVANNA